ncbi:magnesium ion transporter [Verticillium nonalfalfae]|uniref:Magnesium transporter n=1 Tax=Verticillium nonalfalfae TaxID=1051616 RepID=A0A3M9YAT3_9PEZI|nr:magnesium ion transporter [Verticillium nonalfalfae]RNJ56638.1 magnesium ion transporter [Verticillium nonalfalfae]
MSSALRGPVPSFHLLRFLRSQAEHASTGSRCPITSCSRQSSPTPRRPPRCLARLETRRPISTASGLLASRPLRSRTQASVQTQSTQINATAGLPAATCFSTTSTRREKQVDDAGKTERAPSWKEKLWGVGARRGAKPLQPTDLPTHDEVGDGSSMFNYRRILTAKAASEPRLRCTEVDEDGEVILVDGEFKKTELIAKYGLLPRDLRKIDSSNLPHILVRPSAILLNLLHLKVLIKKDRVLLFDIYGSKTSYPQSAFMYDLQGKLKQKIPQGGGGVGAAAGLPYEFRALEAVLTSVTSELEADFEAVRDPVIRILSELEDDIDRHKLRVLLILSKRVSTFEQKAKLVRDAIEELLEADDDLAAMYLTEKAHDLYRGEDDHTEVELLLESYNKLCDEIVQEAQNLVSSIRNTEEIIRAILDANRNSLMLLELKFSIGTLGLAMGTFLAGLYGMNLENFIEDTNWGMGAVTGVSVFFSLIVCWYGLIKLRKVQRVKMMYDERGGGGLGGSLGSRQHWFKDDGPAHLLQATNREKFRRLAGQKAAKATRRWI